MPDFDPHRGPQATREPNRLNRLLSVLMANLRTAWIGLGVLFFVMVVIPGALLIYQSSGKGDQHQADQQQAKQPCEGIHPGAIRKGKIAFDLADEAAPVVQDPEGGIAAPDVWTVNPNGSDPVNLTADSRYSDEHPAWSPDGRRIAFHRRSVADLSEWICVVGPDSSDSIEISPPEGEILSEPSWSPDGRTITFWTTTTTNIYLANADGSGTPKRLPTPRFSGTVTRPEWSPDGDRMAFEGTDEDSGNNLYVMNVSPEGHTSGLRRLTDADNRFFQHVQEAPAWSPDGTQIAFSTNLDRQFEIYKIDVKSLRMTRLTHTPRNVADTQPTWSPDGEQIAYVKQKLARGTHSSIYRMDSDGSHSTPVFEEERKYAFNPDWAP